MLRVQRFLFYDRSCRRPFSNSHQARIMCFPVKCDKCSKTTWGGCGGHIESVKASVKPENWCTCPRK